MSTDTTPAVDDRETISGTSESGADSEGVGKSGRDLGGVSETRMKRWVRQPPASPNVQYLRDAEHDAAVQLLGDRECVLDVASESTVTARIDADSLLRIDFSQTASEYAQELLGEQVDAYAVADPARPAFPFADGSVDGVVCIGPYDWRFLDVETVTTECARVLRPGGRFVFSVPTPKSPYARTGKSRTYTPTAARSLLPPGFRTLAEVAIVQYPGRVHTAVNRLPHVAQRPFVGLAQRLTKGLNAVDRRLPVDGTAAASYIVIAAERTDFPTALDEGLAALFRDVDDPTPGFFDPSLGEEGAITRALTYELAGAASGIGRGQVRWAHDGSNEWRYAPFTLAGVMRWRASKLGDDRHDERIRATLSYFAEQVADDATLDTMPPYATGPLLAAYALATTVEAFTADHDRYAAAAGRLFSHTDGTVQFDDSEDSLVLFGWAWYAQTLDANGPWAGASTTDDGNDGDTAGSRAAVLAAVDRGLEAVLERRGDDGLFAFDNPTTRRHQNQMYTCWGLGKAIEVTGRTDLLFAIEAVLQHTVSERMRADGAFVWEDLPAARRLLDAVHERRTGATAYWRYLYECHQTFFVNAVAAYYAAGGRHDYDDAVRRAMAWIFGNNALGRSLVDIAGIGVPMRQVTTDGRMDNRSFVGGVRDQQYKGTYEVGSYVMALTHLLDGTIA
jgi:SAM-dependent methyltransferase